MTAAQKPSSVLLPAPLGPSSAQCSPACTVSEMPSMICLPSRRNVTSASSENGRHAESRYAWPQAHSTPAPRYRLRRPCRDSSSSARIAFTIVGAVVGA